MKSLSRGDTICAAEYIALIVAFVTCIRCSFDRIECVQMSTRDILILIKILSAKIFTKENERQGFSEQSKYNLHNRFIGLHSTPSNACWPTATTAGSIKEKFLQVFLAKQPRESRRRNERFQWRHRRKLKRLSLGWNCCCAAFALAGPNALSGSASITCDLST